MSSDDQTSSLELVHHHHLAPVLSLRRRSEADVDSDLGGPARSAACIQYSDTYTNQRELPSFMVDLCYSIIQCFP